MKTAKDFNTDGERLEYIKGMLEVTRKVIRGIREYRTHGDISRDTESEMIENEKVCTYNLIEDFFEED